MDVRDSLQSALGSGYRIDREIARGGMSRVFLARDATLDRDVVVKVLPPELAAAVSVERFKREIRFAASLQHPHIVPVLAAGELDGLPYYTMPYVEGESLRERLSRSGRLAVSEALAVLRDVARALAYAHRHGVAHRDVKPENVLLTDGVAVVTDFGIAKALSAARIASGDETLTQAGASLGTPAYMAPEQVAGDPTTDHRADVYALGVVAYEMLSGKPPFHGRGSRELLTAQLSEEPPPLTNARTDVPRRLGQLVMRCLAKAPEARPESAEEIAREIESIIAATGAPHEALAMRRAIPLYGASYGAVALFAWVAMIALGLPDWVLPGAVIIMALGLPVILFKGYVQQAAPRGGAFAVRARPHVTWRRTALGGVLAVVAFSLAVAVYMTLRALGIGPPGTLLARGTLSPNERLLVTDFRVSGLDSSLGPVIAEAMRTGLAESRTVSVATPDAVADALRRMRRSDSEPLDLRLARELAVREGMKAVVNGEITPLGGGYLVVLRLVEADSGNTLAAFRTTADDARGLLRAVDDLTRQLRAKIGESLKSVRAGPPLERVTTSSLEALRKYTEAVRAHVAGDNNKAVRLYGEAVAIDSGFAMAWRGLSAALGNLRLGGQASRAATAMAYRHRDRLTERERFIVDARYFRQLGLDRDKAARVYEELAERYSEPPQNGLGQIWLSRREFARAETLYKNAIARNPDDGLAFVNLTELLVNQGKIAEAERHVALAGTRVPRSAWPRLHAVQLLYMRGELEAYEGALDSLRKSGNPAFTQHALPMLASLALTRGRIADYRRFREEDRQLDAARGVEPRILYDSILAAFIDIEVRRQPASGVRRLDATLANVVPLLPPAQSDLLGMARLYAVAAQPDKARAVLQRYSSELRDTTMRRFIQPFVENVWGYIALAEGRQGEAITRFRNSDSRADGPVTECTICPLRELGLAFDAANEPDSAIAMFEAYVQTPYFQRANLPRANLPRAVMNNLHLNVDPAALAHVYERLGQLYEGRGDRSRAAHYYGRFVELWKNADPELQPRVAEARRRLARLQRLIG